MSPRFGHGANPQKELFAKNVAVNVSFINDNQDIVVGDVLSSDPPAGNDFRQIGIVKNIQNFAQTANFTDVVGTPCYVITVSNPGAYSMDDIITSSDGGRFIVIQKVDTNNDGTYDLVYLQRFYGNITASSTLANATSGATGLSINTVTAPEIDVYSGDIIYMDNRRPIIRDVDQTETIKVVFKF